MKLAALHEIRECLLEVGFDSVPLRTRRIMGGFGEIHNLPQSLWWIGEFANMDADVHGLVEHVRSVSERSVRRFKGERHSCSLFCDWSVYTHFPESRINLIGSDIVLSKLAG
jgi:hypothetical protein